MIMLLLGIKIEISVHFISNNTIWNNIFIMKYVSSLGRSSEHKVHGMCARNWAARANKPEY